LRKSTSVKPIRSATKSDVYDGILARSSAHILESSRKGRDIAPAPKIKNRKRRNAAFASLRIFCETYFPGTFSLAWSEDHYRVLYRLQAAVNTGGQYALAMPRAGGKTSLVERAAMWGVLTGRRRFVVIVAANESLAEQSLGRIKAELEHNPLLLADWPKATYPIHRLESQSRRCVGQLYEGQRTQIVWQRKRLTLPTMPGPDNEASGAVLHVAGLTGAVRGLSHVDALGRTTRPDLLLVDDPQDRESARSVVQTSERLAILNGDLLGLGGPGQRIAALATCTVICRNDLADQLLDGSKSPSWRGERYRLIYEWSERTDLWEEYGRLRAEGFLPGGDRGDTANAFYAAHRAEMDRGARVSWPERFEPGELSAIQHAYNLRHDRGEDVFMAEYQNEPPNDSKQLNVLDPMAIAARCNGFNRGIAPPECEKLTAFVDVGQSLLWWMVCGWDESFGCHILDYGCFPEQRSRMFLARNASPTLEQVFPGGTEAAVYAGLRAIVDRLLSREWERSDGASLKLTRLLIDAGWATDAVRLFIRQSDHHTLMAPTKGFGIGPGQAAINDYRKRPGEKIGDGWILGVAGPDRLRLLRFDSNFWKTQVASMLTRPMGMKGGVSLFGRRAVDHELLASHLTSENPTRVEAKGRAVNVWTRFPDKENHLFDTLVGAAVGASVEGLSPLASIGGKSATISSEPRKRVSFRELWEKRRREELNRVR
jgi:hypothetical protein